MIKVVANGGITSAKGFRVSAVSADIKGNANNKLDLALLLSDTPAVTSSLFTKNLIKAAPIIYTEEILRKSNLISAILVNSNNANACTGDAGYQACQVIAEHISTELGMTADKIFLSSTGVIGVALPVDKILSKSKELVSNLSYQSGNQFASAIMTTDTFSKEYAVTVKDISGNEYVIGGCTKGAGMIAPSLATMLTFITTDADIPRNLLDRALKQSVSSSFNCITVDGEMSTNDTVMIMSNGSSGIKINDTNIDQFIDALEELCLKLALMIVSDAEGGTKLVTIDIKGAKSDQDAKLVAYKIATSPLVKTMFAGSDPNWGRLLSSAGAAGADFDPNNIDIFFEDIHYVAKSTLINPDLEATVHKIMLRDSYKIIIDLHSGTGSSRYYTSDLTEEYIRINSDYRS